MHVNVRDEFVVEAKSNPSTGYNWNLIGSIPHCLELLSTEYVSTAGESSQVVGAPSVLQLRFVAKSVCSGQIQYAYRRSWEEHSDQDATMTINISVYSDDDL